jgi:hypothetical protein
VILPYFVEVGDDSGMTLDVDTLKGISPLVNSYKFIIKEF